MRKSLRLALITSMLALSLLVPARPAEATHLIHVVQRGETLFKIGLKYGLLVTTLKAANGLTGDTIYAGQQLIIPHSNEAGLTQAIPPSNGLHIVQRGENLSRISRRYGVTVSALMAANGLNRTTIYVGERLAIPGPGGTPPAAPAAPPAPSAPGNPVTGIQGKHFVVDLSEQRIYAYDGESLQMTSLVSTGTARYPTVKGLYYIYVKYEAARMRGPGYNLPGVPWVMYFYKGYGVHGTYWHSNFGTPMSHGCVNLSTPNAEWAYAWASVGTPVLVQE